MHIPDGFVNLSVGISTAVLAAGGIAFAIYRTGTTLPESRAPMLGLSAAFVFAAQMLNFPVAGGTSGHLLGASMAAVLLGPSAAIVAMSAVVILQCFLFSDGGVTALGANLFNMAVLDVVVAYSVYRMILWVVSSRPLAAGIGGWCSMFVASAACAGQVTMSGHVKAHVIFPAMLLVHALIGIGEGLITAMVIGSVAKLRPELLEPPRQAEPANRLMPVLAFGLLVSFGLTLFVSPFACPWPDGLEHVAEKLGFSNIATEPVVPGLLPDYQWKGIGNVSLSTAVSGLIGTAAVFVVGWIITRLIMSTRVKVPPMPPSE